MTRNAIFALTALTALTALALPLTASAQGTCEGVDYAPDGTGPYIDVSDAFDAWGELTERYDVPESHVQDVFFAAGDYALQFDGAQALMNVEAFYEGLKDEGVRGADDFAKVRAFVVETSAMMRAAEQQADAKARATYEAVSDLLNDYREVLADMQQARARLQAIGAKLDELRGGVGTKGPSSADIEELKAQAQDARDELATLAAERDSLRAEANDLHAERRSLTALADTFGGGAEVFEAIGCVMANDLANPSDEDGAGRK